jgi:hypothetical protein
MWLSNLVESCVFILSKRVIYGYFQLHLVHRLSATVMYDYSNTAVFSE